MLITSSIIDILDKLFTLGCVLRCLSLRKLLRLRYVPILLPSGLILVLCLCGDHYTATWYLSLFRQYRSIHRYRGHWLRLFLLLILLMLIENSIRRIYIYLIVILIVILIPVAIVPTWLQKLLTLRVLLLGFIIKKKHLPRGHDTIHDTTSGGTPCGTWQDRVSFWHSYVRLHQYSDPIVPERLFYFKRIAVLGLLGQWGRGLLLISLLFCSGKGVCLWATSWHDFIEVFPLIILCLRPVVFQTFDEVRPADYLGLRLLLLNFIIWWPLCSSVAGFATSFFGRLTVF